MSSLKPIVQQECGQPNPLVQLSHQVFSAPSSSQSVVSSNQRGQANDWDQEYLSHYNATAQAPTTFNMHQMLREINRHQPPPQNAAVAPIPPRNVWAEEYLASGVPRTADAVPNDWVAQYTMERHFDQAWRNTSRFQPNYQQPTIGEFKWSHEYLEAVDHLPKLSNDSTAAFGDSTWNQEYAEFVQKVDNGEISLTESGVFDGSAASAQIQKQPDDYFDKLEARWDDLAKNGDEHPWLSEYNDILSMYNDYQMQNENPYADVADPLSEGKRCMAAGELRNAILFFEAAVTKSAENAEGWRYLGAAQAENEQEPKAIAALQKCLQLDPQDAQALQLLAIAYTNESLYDSACRTLVRWLASNEKYAALAPNLDLKRYKPSSFVDRELFKEVENSFVRATQTCGNVVDPELQNMFGVLYNLSGDLDRAIDCFQTTLSVRPEDSRVWNRLGATLANNGRSAEAVAAYRRALELYPAFVRARYNLGISCLNLGAPQPAVDHFLSALSLQYNGVGPSGKADMSNGIWQTLRVAAMSLKRDDLLSMVDARDFEALRNALDVRAELMKSS